MKILSWNVNKNNKRLYEVNKVLEPYDADIICLQEVPKHIVEVLKRNSKYDWYCVVDAKHTKNEEMNTYTVIGSVYEIRQAEKKLLSKGNLSILSKVFYQALCGDSEQIGVAYIDVVVGKKELRIISMRMSTAIGAHLRQELIRKIVFEWNKKENIIIAGDMNIYRGILFRLLSGWIRGYSYKDLVMNEYGYFHNFLYKKGFVNCLKDKITIFPSILAEQPDYIIVPKEFNVENVSVKPRYGSDHNLVLVKGKLC